MTEWKKCDFEFHSFDWLEESYIFILGSVGHQGTVTLSCLNCLNCSCNLCLVKKKFGVETISEIEVKHGF